MSQTPTEILDNAEHISCHVKMKENKKPKMQMNFFTDISTWLAGLCLFRARGTVTWTENCELQTRLRIEMIRSDVRDGVTLLFGCYRVFGPRLLSGLLCWHWSG
jgi:hypothetical protein